MADSVPRKREIPADKVTSAMVESRQMVASPTPFLRIRKMRLEVEIKFSGL